MNIFKQTPECRPISCYFIIFSSLQHDKKNKLKKLNQQVSLYTGKNIAIQIL